MPLVLLACIFLIDLSQNLLPIFHFVDFVISVYGLFLCGFLCYPGLPQPLHPHKTGQNPFSFSHLVRITRVLTTHHSKDPVFIARIQATMTAKGEPWCCAWCLRLDKVNANRCGTRDYLQNQCVDNTCILGGRGSKQKETRPTLRGHLS